MTCWPCSKPIWEAKCETAARLRGRIERILARATVEGLRRGANPATWRGHLQEALPAQILSVELDQIESHPGIALNEHYEGDGEIIFKHACKLGCEGIVSKRLGSTYRSGRSDIG